MLLIPISRKYGEASVWPVTAVVTSRLASTATFCVTQPYILGGSLNYIQKSRFMCLSTS